MYIKYEVMLMKKETAITVLITVIVGVAIFISCLGTKITLRANTYYQVYLNGNKIGIIEDKNNSYVGRVKA